MRVNSLHPLKLPIRTPKTQIPDQSGSAWRSTCDMRFFQLKLRDRLVGSPLMSYAVRDSRR